jgi:hypothetical protein
MKKPNFFYKNQSFFISPVLLEDKIFGNLLKEYLDDNCLPIATVWMSQLLIELAISKSLRCLLNSVVDEDFADKFIRNNYRISYTKDILVICFSRARDLGSYLNKYKKTSFSSRETLDDDFFKLKEKISIDKNLDEALSSLPGFKKRCFIKEFSFYKKLRHDFRQGKHSLNINSVASRLLTFDYISRLSVMADETISDTLSETR